MPEALLTQWTPLRRLVDENGPQAVITELADIAEDLEKHARSKATRVKWAQAVKAMRIAQEYAGTRDELEAIYEVNNQM